MAPHAPRALISTAGSQLSLPAFPHAPRPPSPPTRTTPPRYPRKQSFYDAEPRALRQQLRGGYEALLFLDAAFAAANDVEQALWKSVFYRPIEEFRARLRKAEKVRGPEYVTQTRARRSWGASPAARPRGGAGAAARHVRAVCAELAARLLSSGVSGAAMASNPVAEGSHGSVCIILSCLTSWQ
jgi:hypothetical protein